MPLAERRAATADRLAAGRPTTSPTNRIAHSAASGARASGGPGGGVDRHRRRCCRPSARVRRERLALDRRDVDDGADLRRGREHGRADRQRRVGAQLDERDEHRRRLLRAACRCGCPTRLPSITKSLIAAIVPSTGEYTSVPGAAPTSSTVVPGRSRPRAGTRPGLRPACRRSGARAAAAALRSPGDRPGRAPSAPSPEPRNPIAGHRLLRRRAAAGAGCRPMPGPAARVGVPGHVGQRSARSRSASRRRAASRSPNAVNSSVTRPSTPTSERTTSQRARCWARRLRARRRAACRERGVGITATVAHADSRHSCARIAAPAPHTDGPASELRSRMSEPSGATIRIPRWVQLVGLPVLFLVAFMLARPLGHVIFLFLTAAVIAFMLNPLVRDLQRLRLPRGALRRVRLHRSSSRPSPRVLIGLGTIAFDQTRTAGERIDTYVTEESAVTGKTGLQEDVDRLQTWLNDHGLENVKIEEQVDDWIASLGAGEISGYVQDALSFAQGAALSVILFFFARDPDHRDLDLHAPRHAEAGGDDRPPLPASRRPAAHAADRAGAVGVRQGSDDPLARDRHERRRRDVDPRHDRPRRGRRALRAPVRAVDGVHRGDPVHRAVAVRGSACDLRALRRPGRGHLGAAALPLHLPGRGPCRRAERDGQRAPPAPAARHLRAARGWRAVRHPRRARRAADDGGHARHLGVLRRAHRLRPVGRGGRSPSTSR